MEGSIICNKPVHFNCPEVHIGKFTAPENSVFTFQSNEDQVIATSDATTLCSTAHVRSVNYPGQTLDAELDIITSALNSASGSAVTNTQVTNAISSALTSYSNTAAMNAAIAAASPYQITRSGTTAGIRVETSGRLSYEAVSGQYHDFKSDGASTMRLYTTAGLKNTGGFSTSAGFYLNPTPLGLASADRGSLIHNGSEVELAGNALQDVVRLTGNTIIQPRANGNLIEVRSASGTVKLLLTDSSATLGVPLALGTNKLTGLAPGTAVGDAVEFAQVSSLISAGSHNAYEIKRGNTLSTIDGTGNLQTRVDLASSKVWSVANLGGDSKLYLTNTQFSVTVPIAMGGTKMSGLLDGSSPTDAATFGQVSSAIASAHNSFELTRSGVPASVSVESTGQLIYNVSSGQNHDFRVSNTTNTRINATGVLTNQLTSSAGGVILSDTPFGAGTNRSSWTWSGAGTSIADSALADAIKLGGNVLIQPTTTNASLLAVNNQGGASKMVLSNTGMTLSVPLAMGGQKVTNMAAGSAAGDAVEFSQLGSAVSTALSSYSNYQITRNGTSLTIDGGGDLTLNSASGFFYIKTPASAFWTNWSTSSGIQYIVDYSRHRVTSDNQTSWLEFWGSSGQPYISSSTGTLLLDSIVSLNNKRLTNLATPSTGTDGATKNYVDSAVTSVPLSSLSVPTVSVNLNSQRIISLGTPSASTDATTKSYVDAADSALLTQITSRALITTPLNSLTAPTGSLSLNSQKIVALANGALSTDAVALGQVSDAISRAHNSYELIRGGVGSYAQLDGSGNVFLNSEGGGAVWGYYGGLPVFVVGSAACETYTGTTGFSWKKSNATQIWKLTTESSGTKCSIEAPQDNLVQRSNTTIRPYAANGETLRVNATNDIACATFWTSTASAGNYLDMNSHAIKSVKDPTELQDAATMAFTLKGNYPPQPFAVSNGVFEINQRNSTFPDRWITYTPAIYINYTNETITDLPGFTKCMRAVSTGVSNDLAHTYQRIEGTYAKAFNWGSSSCVGATVSLWIKSSIANHRLPISLHMPNASETFYYECCSTVVSSSTPNTWTRVSAYFPACPVGHTPRTDAGNANYITINPLVMGGGTWGNGVEGTWSAANGVRNLGLANGTTQQMNVSGITLRWTGLQMDIGNTMRSYNPLGHEQHLNHCLRYLWRVNSTGTGSAAANSSVGLYTTTKYVCTKLPVRMRSGPVVTFSSPSILQEWSHGVGSPYTTYGATSHTANTEDFGAFYYNTYSATPYYCAGLVQFNAPGAWLEYAAELI